MRRPSGDQAARASTATSLRRRRTTAPSARDAPTSGILKDGAGGRGSPHRGAWLSFQHCSEAVLREAFGPVIDRLAANGIDLTRQPIEVAPIAHYHMGGMRAGADMQTTVPHLFAAGEAVGGANGANRLSGNAITEALTFGRRAGERAAALAAKIPMPAIDPSSGFSSNRSKINPAAEIVRLQKLMNEHVGPLRTQGGLERRRFAVPSGTAPGASCTVFPPVEYPSGAVWPL